MDEAEARLGTRLGNYFLRSIIGRGGMGVVYRAEHVYLQRPVAVKVLHGSYFDQADARERFLREAQTAGVIDHPNIIGVTDFGEADDGTVFLVMAHVEGTSLEQVLQTELRLPLFRTLVILSQVTRALAAAHEKGVIHHDLKPENILLRPRNGRREVVRELADARGTLELVEPEGSYDFVTVLDFGAAKFLDQAAAGAGVVVGTPAYMAPETASNGIADQRSDVYAVGIIFYEMLTGTAPFDDTDPVEVMVKQVQAPVPPLRERCPDAEITPEAERTILRALAKDPDLRHQTMDELNADIQRCYGSVRFRRTMQILPSGLPAETLRKPIPLTQLKQRADAADPPPQAAAPILLTRRKSGRHKTLPFGAATPAPEVVTQPAGKPRAR
jgi:serine/threonine protein kinase